MAYPPRRAEDLETLTPGPHTLRVDVIVAYRDGLAPLIGNLAQPGDGHVVRGDPGESGPLRDRWRH
jgi:hypothetical protein